jgi:hypothetical protein
MFNTSRASRDISDDLTKGNKTAAAGGDAFKEGSWTGPTPEGETPP